MLNDPWTGVAVGVLSFAACWWLVGFFNARRGGWQALAKRYRCDHRPPLLVFRRWQSLVMSGTTSYSFLNIGSNQRGVYLAMARFIFAHPALFIPWEDIEISTARTATHVFFHFKDVPRIAAAVPTSLGVELVHAAGRSLSPSAQTR